MMTQTEYENYLRSQGFGGSLQGFYENYVANYDPLVNYNDVIASGGDPESPDSSFMAYTGGKTLQQEIASLKVGEVVQTGVVPNPDIATTMAGGKVTYQTLMGTSIAFDAIWSDLATLPDYDGMITGLSKILTAEELASLMGAGSVGTMALSSLLALNPMIILAIVLLALWLLGISIDALMGNRKAVYYKGRRLGVIEGNITSREGRYKLSTQKLGGSDTMGLPSVSIQIPQINFGIEV